jgi:8-oxo-dGTP diphosphatase
MPQKDQGSSSDRYTVIPRTLIFILKENNVLLIKGKSNKKIWPNLYNGLGGHVEKGEDVMSAARRELYEESGITDAQLNLCGIISVDLDGLSGIEIFVFRGVTNQQTLKSSDEGNLEWIDLSEIERIPVVEDLRTIIPLVVNKLMDAQPFFARYFYDAQDKLKIEFSENGKSH